MAKKKSQRALSKERADFLAKREEILKSQVNSLQVKLFEKIVNNYLIKLEQSDGKIVADSKNVTMVQGLEIIYKNFQQQDNSPIIQKWLSDMNVIHDLNVKYFMNISKEGVRASQDSVKLAMNKTLGLDEAGKPLQGGFTDKFIRDDKTLKQIKRLTNKAINNGKPFTEFRQDMKDLITGNKEQGGALQKYYRNYAYDTYQKVDRINGQAFAQSLDLKYFIYQGGLINTSRPLCQHYNGRIVNSKEFSELEKKDLPEDWQSGLPDNWKPLIDLGGYGCRHSKDWITDDVALRNKDKYDKAANQRR